MRHDALILVVVATLGVEAMRKQNISLTLPRSLVDQLKGTAKACNISVSQLVEELVQSAAWDDVCQNHLKEEEPNG